MAEKGVDEGCDAGVMMVCPCEVRRRMRVLRSGAAYASCGAAADEDEVADFGWYRYSGVVGARGIV